MISDTKKWQEEEFVKHWLCTSNRGIIQHQKTPKKECKQDNDNNNDDSENEVSNNIWQQQEMGYKKLKSQSRIIPEPNK